jgi:hypothetical protein
MRPSPIPLIERLSNEEIALAESLVCMHLAYSLAAPKAKSYAIIRIAHA